MANNESSALWQDTLSSPLSDDSNLPNSPYKALDLQKRQIRLFKIEKATFTSLNITGSLETFELHCCPSFYALSYEWGTNNAQCPLIVNGCYLYIRDNLMRFLACYCQDIEWYGQVLDNYLWIDQICIDQYNTFERNHQVQLMNPIFTTAEVVIVWLGPDCEDSLQYFQSNEFQEWCVSPALQLEPLPELAEKFLAQSFWSRLWVQQELIGANEMVFMSSTTFIFSAQVKKMKGHRRVRAETGLFRALGTPLGFFSLYEAITCFSHKHCTDPRDKVFALLGIVIPSERIEVDYNLATRDVFQLTVGNVVHAEKWLKTGLHNTDISRPVIALGVGMGLDVNDVNTIYRNLANWACRPGIPQVVQNSWSANLRF